MSALRIFSITEPQQPYFQTEDVAKIAEKLQQQGVRFEQWQASAPISADSSAEQVLAAYADDITRLKQQQGYSNCDVM